MSKVHAIFFGRTNTFLYFTEHLLYSISRGEAKGWPPSFHEGPGVASETPNPVAAALMAKMKIAPKDRPRVKLECLRLLATLRIDPARSKLIGGFVDSYLTLTSQELQQYRRQFEALGPKERETNMALISSWEQKGIDQGISQGIDQGMERIVTRQLHRRLGDVPTALTERLHGLTPEQMERLSEDLLDFTTAEDFERWLSRL